MAQMDIMDGKFVSNTTFADPQIASKYKVGYELDLMVNDPGPYLTEWKAVRGVKRAFVHAEIKKPLLPLLKKIRSYAWEAGVALNPDTPWKNIVKLVPALDCVLFMTVYPGQNAAPFQPKVIPNIAQFHRKHPDILIAVDGGVNGTTLPQLLKAGVTRFAVGSAIWSAPDPLLAYKKLLKLIAK